MKLKLSVTIIFYILSFFCLIPFSFNLKTLKFNFSIKSLLWCIIFSLILILIDPYFEEVVFKTQIMEANATGIAARIFKKGTYIMVLICVYCSIFTINQIFKIINLLKVIFEKLNKFGTDFSESENVLKKVLIKILAVQISALIVHYICIRSIFVTDQFS